MKNRIVLTNSYSSGESITTPEQAWYRNDTAQMGFNIQAKNGRWVRLMDFFLPRQMTELMPDAGNPTGYNLVVKEEYKKFRTVMATDFEQYIEQWPASIEDEIARSDMAILNRLTESEVRSHRLAILKLWTVLTCAWFNKDKSVNLCYHMRETDEQLRALLCDFYLIRREMREAGIKAFADSLKTLLLENRFSREIRNWLREISCALEILTTHTPAIGAILAVDRGANYPCMWAGYKEMKKHKGGAE